jgi:hypothetical protein
MFEFLGTLLFFICGFMSNGNHVIAVAGINMAVMFVGKVSGGYFNFGVACGVYVLEGKYK